MFVTLRKIILEKDQQLTLPPVIKDIKILHTEKIKWTVNDEEKEGLEIWYFRISD